MCHCYNNPFTADPFAKHSPQWSQCDKTILSLLSRASQAFNKLSFHKRRANCKGDRIHMHTNKNGE